MSAVPEDIRTQGRRREDMHHTPEQKFWAWFALAVLLFCWIAEATMCADRGF